MSASGSGPESAKPVGTGSTKTDAASPASSSPSAKDAPPTAGGSASPLAAPAGKAANSSSASSRPLQSTLSLQATGQARLDAFMRNFHSDDKVLVIISADPDAIASAVAVKRLLWRKVSQVTIASINQVKRPDNLQLIDVLKLKMEALKSLKPEAFSRLVMVDSQPGHSPQTETLPFVVVIDHHPCSTLVAGQTYPAYVDIRSDLGATATMMAGYLKTAKIKPNHRLATALFYAIKTDTRNFIRQGQLEDMNAFRWLYPFINPQLLSDIEKAPIARSSFNNIVSGLDGAVFTKNSVHTFLCRTDHPDTLVIVADFLMQVKGVNRSVAAGIFGQKLVIIMRGSGPRQNVGQLAEKAFGEFGSAGGHKSMARAEIPLENLDSKIRDNVKALGRFIVKRLSGGENKKVSSKA